MMNDTKIRIWQLKNTVSYQITECDGMDNILIKGDLFTASNGYIIRSDGNMGGITKYSITLPSYKPSLYVVGSGRFNNESEASEVCEKIKIALTEWKESGYKVSDKKRNSIFDDGYHRDYFNQMDMMDEYMEMRAREFERNHPNATNREFQTFMMRSEDEYMSRNRGFGFGFGMR